MARECSDARPALHVGGQRARQCPGRAEPLGEAIDAFTIAIEEKPDHAMPYNNRALALMRRGELAAAERDLKKASSRRPDLADIGYNLATVLQDQGRVPRR